MFERFVSSRSIKALARLNTDSFWGSSTVVAPALPPGMRKTEARKRKKKKFKSFLFESHGDLFVFMVKKYSPAIRKVKF